MKLGVVIVNYRSDDLTERFIREQLTRTSVPLTIVVVDNGASREEAFALESRLGGVKVIPADNGGFAKGNNIGARYLRENGNPDYILFTNNDVEIVDDDVIESLLSEMENKDSIAAIGPEVVGLDGLRQGPEPYMGPWKRFVWMYLVTPFVSASCKRKLFMQDYPEMAGKGEHYKISGCFFIARSSDFFTAGMFDEKTFLYAEENILSERFRAIGKSFYYLPSTRIVHMHGQTISRTVDNKRASMLQFDSMSYYYIAYKGISKATMSVIKALFRCILKLKR